MNSRVFVFDVLERVLACERRLSACCPCEGRNGLIGGFPKEILKTDSPAAGLLLAALNGTTRLGEEELACLSVFSAYETLLTAGRRGLVDRDAVCAHLLAQCSNRRVPLSERLETVRTRPRRPAADLPLDDLGHGPRWYANLFARIRPRYASFYLKLDSALKHFGYPGPEARDGVGLSLDDCFRAVLPPRADYLSVGLPGGREDAPGEVRPLDRAEGERLARTGETSARLLFRLVPGGRFGRDAYLAVFPLTRAQESAIAQGKGMSPRPGELPWTVPPARGIWSREKELEAYEVPLHMLRRLAGLASVDLPDAGLWKRACRAGTESGGNGDPEREASCLDLGWTALDSGLVPHPVGLRKPNALGFYDLHGNVCECCWTGRRLPTLDLRYEFRGGSYLSMPADCTSSAWSRNVRSEEKGLRPAIYL